MSFKPFAQKKVTRRVRGSTMINKEIIVVWSSTFIFDASFDFVKWV